MRVLALDIEVKLTLLVEYVRRRTAVLLVYIAVVVGFYTLFGIEHLFTRPVFVHAYIARIGERGHFEELIL